MMRPPSLARYITDFLESSKESLDLGIHLFTSARLAKTLVDAHKRGVTVRVLSDRNMFTASSSQIKMLFKLGVPVKYSTHEYLMHWKTVIVDKKKVMTGSLNWTLRALQNNWENVVVTDQRDCVQQAVQCFEDLWNDSASRLLGLER